MTSIIKPEDFSNIKVEPLTHKYWNKYTIAIAFDLNLGALSNHYGFCLNEDTFKAASSENVEALLNLKRTEEWLEKNCGNRDYKVKRTVGRWKYERHTWLSSRHRPNKCLQLPRLMVYLDDADFAQEVIENTQLPVAEVRAILSEDHAEQLDDAVSDTVELRKQYYWDKYNFKIAYSTNFALSKDQRRALFADLCTISARDVRWDEYSSTYYVFVPEDLIDELAFLKLSYGEGIKRITRVELIKHQ